MLFRSDSATTVVKAIIDQNPGADNVGVRINSQGADANFELGVAVVAGPEDADLVVEHDGARVFLDETATTLLSDKVLDAQVGEDGSVNFAIGQQPGV